MNEIVVVEIEKTARLNFIAVPYYSPVWKYLLYQSSYVKHLAFMAVSSSYPTDVFTFSDLVIDYQRYYKATNLSECMNYDASFFVDGPNLYVHGLDDRPVWFYFSKMYGAIFGFTNRGVRRYNRTTYHALVESVPNLSEGTDPIEYSRMAFNGGSLTIRNATKYFDQRASVFGNDVNVKTGPDDGKYESLRSVAKYWIENYTVDVNRAKFALKDRRELLSAKAPNTYFSATAYADIEDNKIGKVIPDAFGELLGVPGICVNGKSGSSKTFKFGAVITRLDHIYVNKDEKWTEVTAASTNLAIGEVTLSAANAHVDGSTSKGIVKVKADGLFRPEVNPGDVIAKINEVYGGIDYLPGNYDIAEWEAELGPLADVALYMGESKDINEWIEKVQNGSTVGFQYMTNFDKITARLDNPNRTVATKMRAVEILNIQDVEIDYNATIYASAALIRYSMDQESKSGPQVLNEDHKIQVLEVHRKEKQYETDSLLTNATDALLKSEVIMDDQKAIRPIFKNLKFSGMKWFDLRLYDMVDADISIPGVYVAAPYPFDVTVIFPGANEEVLIKPGLPDFKRIIPTYDAVGIELIVPILATEERSNDYKLIVPGFENVEVIQPMGVRGEQVVKNTNREFVGSVRCQVVGRKPDVENCTVSFDLRQRDESSVVAVALEA